MQLQSGQSAEWRDLVVAEQDFVLGDQHALGVENVHPVVDEPRFQDLIENAQGIVDPQRVRGLSQAHARNRKGRSALDQDDLDATTRQDRGRRQSADTAADHQHAPNFIHNGSPVRR